MDRAEREGLSGFLFSTSRAEYVQMKKDEAEVDEAIEGEQREWDKEEKNRKDEEAEKKAEEEAKKKEEEDAKYEWVKDETTIKTDFLTGDQTIGVDRLERIEVAVIQIINLLRTMSEETPKVKVRRI